jgi:ATP-dependent helicase/nuclease subunit B
MQSFLQKIVNHITTKYPDNIGDICIVLPNRRAGLFLKTHMADVLGKTFWAPEVYAIEDFVTLLSELQPADTTTLLFELYETHKRIHPGAEEPFDDFSRWGQLLLNDLNDIDRYLVDATQLFGNLKDIKELETWTLNSEEELTDFQKQYVKFWKSLGSYYSIYKDQLLAKHIAYQGLAYRVVVELVLERINKYPWKKIIFAGFNALNKAEENIIQTLLNAERAEIIWDVDSYYVNDLKQEAGFFYRKYRGSGIFSKLSEGEERNIVFEENLLGTQAKQVHIIGATKNVAQAKLAGSIVQHLQATDKALQNTALVLADENLLFPVLHSLPDNLNDVNVTMGYPLKSTPMAGYFDLLFNLHINALKISKDKNNYSYYYRDLLNFLSHPYSSTLIFEEKKYYSLKPAIKTIQEKNILFASSHTIEKLTASQGAELFEKLKPVFINWHQPADALACMWTVIESLKNSIIAQQTEELKKTASLELEYLYAFTKIFKRIEALMIDYPNSITDVKTLYAVVKQIIQTSTLPFYGEPLLGLQVMGMLETRTLDFENVILLSCNESILPSGKTGNSFIPFELKRYFGLPTYSDKDAIFAYHFYRLLQRAKNIYLLYNTENDALGMGEKSRFLTQLIHELPRINKNIVIKEELYSIPAEVKSPGNIISINKTLEILNILKEKAVKGFSPSLLNIYVKCPLQFYFHAVLGLKEYEDVEETVGAETLGIVIHGVLENLYKPYIGHIIKEEHIDKMRGQVEALVTTGFEAYYNNGEMSFGKNMLTARIAIKFISNFLNTEYTLIQDYKAAGSYITIHQLEEKLVSHLQVGDELVNFKGTADRIDGVGGQIRIIDYKTGKAEDKELKIKEWSQLSTDTNLAKSFQLLMYAWMYKKSNPEVNTVKSGIISFRQLSAGLKTVKINDADTITESEMLLFEEQLNGIVSEIFNKSQAFNQTKELDNCKYCSFKGICGRMD